METKGEETILVHGKKGDRNRSMLKTKLREKADKEEEIMKIIYRRKNFSGTSGREENPPVALPV